jgi:hypothetical protein
MRKVMLVALMFAITRVYCLEIIHHEIKPHENLFRISLIYNSTVPDIVKANPGINPEKILSGTTIRIPAGTKVRDAGFVTALLNGKRTPAPMEVRNLAQAQAVEDKLAENPFTSPKKPRKSIEQMEKEAALENNVSKKAFEPELKAVDQTAAIPVSPGPSVNPVRKTPKIQSVYDQWAELQANDDNPFIGQGANAVGQDHPAVSVAERAIGEANTTTTIENANNGPAIDLTQAKIGVVENCNSDILNQLRTLIDANQIIAINLQIVLKDGSVRTISSHEEQKRILAQLATGN